MCVHTILKSNRNTMKKLFFDPETQMDCSSDLLHDILRFGLMNSRFGPKSKVREIVDFYTFWNYT